MCSSGGGGGSVTGNTLRAVQDNPKAFFGDAVPGSSTAPTSNTGGSAAVPTTSNPTGNGDSPTPGTKTSSLMITRNRKRASGTASAPGGGTGLNIPT